MADSSKDERTQLNNNPVGYDSLKEPHNENFNGKYDFAVFAHFTLCKIYISHCLWQQYIEVGRRNAWFVCQSLRVTFILFIPPAVCLFRNKYWARAQSGVKVMFEKA